MLNSIKSYKNGTLTKDELELEWFQMIYSKPKKFSNGRMIQESWTNHPISKSMIELRNHSPMKIKKSISLCIQYSKSWWNKSTDTYLFPTYAISLFIDSLDINLMFNLIEKEKTTQIYKHMSTLLDPIDKFTKTIVASDQHTTLGSKNGVGKKSKYALPCFVLYHSAVRPYTRGQEETMLKYIKRRLPNLPDNFQLKAYENLKQFGESKIDEKELWQQVLNVMYEGLNLMNPEPYQHWKQTEFKPKRKEDEEIFHTNENAKFHFKCTPLEDGWQYDSLISLVQKSIRRSNLFNAVWATCRILMFALFHKKTNVSVINWCILPSAQAKITNLINRLIVIVAEDFFPCAKIFCDSSQLLEQARKELLKLKQPQPPDIYQDRFYSIVRFVLSVIVSIIQLPKQHHVGSVMFKHKKIYDNAASKIENSNNKRKREEPTTLFNFWNKK